MVIDFEFKFETEDGKYEWVGGTYKKKFRGNNNTYVSVNKSPKQILEVNKQIVALLESLAD